MIVGLSFGEKKIVLLCFCCFGCCVQMRILGFE